MGASTKYYCRVLKTHEEIVEVYAVTSDEAAEMALEIPKVVMCLGTGRTKEELDDEE